MQDINDLSSQLRSESEKTQLKLIPQLIEIGDPGWATLMDWMYSVKEAPVNLAIGKAYQALFQANTPQTQEFLQTNFPQGIVPLKSERNIDYQPLQSLLAKQEFEEADVLTLQKMCEVAGATAVSRKWIYFTEIDKFPIVDLQTIDNLWRIHSEGKFGFSVQRKIWLSLGKDYAKLWEKIDWKKGNTWTRYPNGFTWDLTAPQGHLPLSNQLRGVRVIDAIFAHPAWNKS